MAKKEVATKAAVTKTNAVTTPMRNSAIPKAVPAKAARVVSHETIAFRAYEISQSGQRASDDENWLRAERELKGL